MKRIQALCAIAFLIFFFLTQSKPIFSASKALISADSKRFDRDGQSVVVGAGEEIPSYDGKGTSNIVVTEGGSVSGMDLHDSATASVKGGEISHLFLHDTSSLKLFDRDKQNNSGDSSSISSIHLHDSATAFIKGEEVSHINLYDTSNLSVSGNAIVSHLTLKDETQGEILDARVSFLTLEDRSKVHVRSLDIDGGSFSTPGVKVSGGAVILDSNTALNIYGRKIDLKNGKLSGIWADGTHFEFWSIRRVRDNWFWSFWRAGDEELKYKIPKSIPKQVIFHQIYE